jgi:hypothetical protein
MKKILFCSILVLSLFIISYSYAPAEKIEICAAKSEPSRSGSPDASKKISIAKPVIKNVTVGEEGREVMWVVSIENSGTAPTSGQDALQFYRDLKSGNPPRLGAGGVAVPVINPGQTKEVKAGLNPDPQTGQYTIELVSKGKVIQQRPYGLGLPTMEVGEIKVADDMLAWEAVVNNTWLFGLRDIKVQAFKKSASQKNWEPLGESRIDYLQGRASSTVKGKGNSAGANEFKVAVFLRRVQAEPYVEMASKTLNLKK